MITRVKFHGIREIREAMQSLPRRIDRPLLEKALIVGAMIVRDEARARAPMLRDEYSYTTSDGTKVVRPRARRSGVLRRAIRAGRVRPEDMAAKVWVRVRKLTGKQIGRFKKRTGLSASDNPNDPFYWRFVEFGTSKMAARPFLRPAFEGAKFRAVEKIIAEARIRVQKAIGELGAGARAYNRLGRLL